MRLRLVHTLSLTLMAFTGVAVLALGGLTAWHLRNGFGDYLAAREVQHFERFVGFLEARLAREGGVAALQAGRLELRELLSELGPRPAGPGGLPRLPPPPGAGAREAAAFPERVQVVAPDGTVWLGPARIAAVTQPRPVVERPVHAGGRVVALARLQPAPIVRSGAEAHFLTDQYALIAAGGLGLIVLALLTAIALARRWTHPLAAVQQATQRLAQGELTVRLPEGPTLAGRSDEIGDVMRNVNRMAEGLQQLEGARRRWLADISHELRTPLTVLRGDIEALHDGVRPLRPEAIAVLHEEVLRLNRLVDDLHLLAIADLQTLPCHLADDDAVALMQRLLGRYDGRARAGGLSLRLELADEVKALGLLPVQWDAGRIEQLLANLLENSLRYTQAPGQVLMRLAQVDARVRVVVEDSAPGVPAGQLAQLFEPLYRGDAARSGGLGGSGLGLAICQRIAQAHGGRLTASASALGGLRLTLDLPLNLPLQPGPPQRRPTGSIA
jgi:two-component system, OmpR family, sensor histidine kinase BaeS